MATVQKRGGGYKITVSCGYDINGKQIRRNMTWNPEPGMTARQVDKELQRQAVLFEERCRTGQVLDGNIKFADFAEFWFKEYADKQCRLTTVDGYKKLVDRTYVAIGHIRLDKLQPHHLMAFYNNLAEPDVRTAKSVKVKVDLKPIIKASGATSIEIDKECGFARGKISKITHGACVTWRTAQKVADFLEIPVDELFEPAQEVKPLSGNTILHYHRFISVILSTAVKWQIIPSNPCARLDPPKAKRKEAHYLDEYQAAHLLDLLDSEPEQYRCLITLLLYTGLRRGEVLGLEWKDIDFDLGLLSIRRTCLYIAKRGIFTDETKTDQSSRVLKLTEGIMLMLKQHRALQQQERLKLGDKWQDTDRLFTRWNGLPMNPNNLTKWFCEFVRRTDMPPACIHSLRHTNATLLIAGGANIKTVSSHLGHSVVSTTGNIYTHAIQSAEAAAAEALENKLLLARKKRA